MLLVSSRICTIGDEEYGCRWRLVCIWGLCVGEACMQLTSLSMCAIGELGHVCYAVVCCWSSCAVQVENV